ncbi:MAG: Hsp20/alpha crystallin family protein [Beutenbergiaceae bacterium]
MTSKESTMALDLYRTADAFVATLDLPGVDPASIDIDTDGKALTVRAERSRPAGDDIRWLVRGRGVGSYRRRFPLGEGVDADGVRADYTNGVLTLTVPLAEQAKPRKVEVTSGQTATPATALDQAA